MTGLFSIGSRLTATLQKGISFLEDSACENIGNFILSRQNEDGGFKGRASESDLYYTYFGCELIKAFESDRLYKRSLAAAESYLSNWGNPGKLDFVHLVSLIRSLSLVSSKGLESRQKKEFSSLIDRYKAARGGFNRKQGSKEAAIYDTFLFLTVSDVLGRGVFMLPTLIGSVSTLLTRKGSLAGRPTPVLSALLSIRQVLKIPGTGRDSDFLYERMDTNGGFYAVPGAPAPDLLSTGAALFALKNCGLITYETARISMDFIECCSSEGGGFFAGCLDTEPDIEYTFYGLLALGSLVL